ncbi:nucleoside-diphosphate sugar epimerase/dehydratase [Marinobacterium rhizophilum]|uniref:Transposase n=1 Tax=Marinobacterium rhizophilum TaxID=420402 RepID=A0ABY5HEG2_9GAMM|nr:hypothetical protein [Marinobacterium rhizophilum]UTW10613.1 hypothetical protein KDW95_15090 [Marinobacterium rhizophilum]
MNAPIQGWRRLLARLRPQRTRSLIMLGIDTGCHRWHTALNEGTGYRVRAFIDDEPWNHRTRIGDAPVHYPSEVLALALKHRVCALVEVQDNARPASTQHCSASSNDGEYRC